MELLSRIVSKTPSKVVLFVIDGLGGLPHPQTGKTELETAHTPNLDKLAGMSELGLIYPVAPGIIPGSAPAHLALFGYDPVEHQIGRGVIEALGVGFELKKGDIAARGNFCTLKDGKVVDRRAGRLSDEKGQELCHKLSQIYLDGVEIFILPVKEHRFALILRGEGLDEHLSDTDPQKTGLPPLWAVPLKPEAERTASLVNDFIRHAQELLSSEFPANSILLRGFSSLPPIPSLSQLYHLSPAAIASYPMYRGLAKLVGMTVLSSENSWNSQVQTLKKHFPDFDFFFFHIKETDMAGEDGDFDRKVKLIEEIDKLIPEILTLSPDVLIITGDHSTPALLRSHSWHPVPLLLYSPFSRHSGADKFGEGSCYRGTLGCFAATQVMPLALAYAGKLSKFGP